MIYLTELAEKLGIDPVEAARAKVEINGKKYPAALVRGSASKQGSAVRDLQEGFQPFWMPEGFQV